MRKNMGEAVEKAKQEAEKAVGDISVAVDPAVTAVKEELRAAGQQAAPIVEKAKAAVTEDLHEVQQKAAPILQQTMRKADPAVKRVRTAVKKAEPSLKAATATAAATGKQLASAIVPEIYVQYGTQQYSAAQIAERCRADYRSTHKVGVHSCKVYIKPEDGMAYYVINQTAGKITL